MTRSPGPLGFDAPLVGDRSGDLCGPVGAGFAAPGPAGLAPDKPRAKPGIEEAGDASRKEDDKASDPRIEALLEALGRHGLDRVRTGTAELAFIDERSLHAPAWQHFEVVPPHIAVRTVSAVSASHARTPAIRDLLSQAASLLAAPGSEPGMAGLLLLRRREGESTSPPRITAPAVTPSELRRAVTPEPEEEPVYWVEFELQDAHAKPLANTRCRIKLPDGQTVEVASDGAGLIRFPDLEAQGKCEIVLLPDDTPDAA